MMSFDLDFLKAAHRHSSRHRDELKASALCGCFFCLAAYSPTEVKEWCDDERTALCPRCGIDSVLADQPSVPVTEATFLKAMREHWFER
jgi:hypothetical protein